MATTFPPQSAATTAPGHGKTQSTTESPIPNIPSIHIEMSDLDTSRQTTVGGPLGDVSIPILSPMDASFTDASKSNPSDSTSKPDQLNAAIPAPDSKEPSSSNTTSAPATTDAPQDSSAAPAITRLDSVAIGPSTEESPVAAISEAGPVLVITLLLTSGARHPYKIDERYLTKRNVTVPDLTEGGKKDPFSISIYTLKELILREWREEWEAAPSSPSSIRLIFFGRLLDDSSPLKDCRFNAEGPNVVHMTVRPQDIVDDEEAAKGKAASGNRGDGEDTAGCRCVIL